MHVNRKSLSGFTPTPKPKVFGVSSVKAERGFTLVEFLLVFALFAVVLGTIAPLAWSFVVQNDLDTSTIIAAQSLRRAQDLAMAVSFDSSWGVKFNDQTATIFSGGSYVGRNSDLDEVFNFPQSLTILGSSEIVFNKFSGQPSAPGIVSLSNGLSQSRDISINVAGSVSY